RRKSERGFSVIMQKTRNATWQMKLSKLVRRKVSFGFNRLESCWRSCPGTFLFGRYSGLPRRRSWRAMFAFLKTPPNCRQVPLLLKRFFKTLGFRPAYFQHFSLVRMPVRGFFEMNAWTL